MGVHGLWKLLEPAGKAVALETLQNKILGVDVSIWLHQAMKGFQDRKGSPLPNAHLLGIFHRVCKLLFYRIKPVFVFDGGVPVLKKSTIAARRKFKGRAAHDAKQVAEQLLKNLIKHKAVRKVLGEKAGKSTVSDDRPRRDENLFDLPPMLNDLNEYQSLSSDSEASVKYEPSGEESESDQDVKYLSPSKVYAMNLDLHTLDVKSENFRSLPADVRHDILSDLKETRKQSSWGRLHEMPQESTDFSSFQLNRLLKRRNVQVSLEEAEKEMGGKVLSMAELEDIMSAQGVKLEDGVASSKEAQLNAYSKRIASDVATRFLLVTESALNKTPQDHSDKKKEPKKDAQDEKIKMKQEHEDDWSSDESIKEVKVKKEPEEVKMKEEYEDDWSSGDEAREIADEHLAERFINEKDSLSQAEILALIQNEKTRDEYPADGPSTSRAAGSMSPTTITEPSTSKADLVVGSSNDDIVDISSDKGNFVVSKTKASTVRADAVKASLVKGLSTDRDDLVEISSGKDDFVVSKTRASTVRADTVKASPVKGLNTDRGDLVDVSSGKDDFVVSKAKVSTGKANLEVKSSLKTPPKKKDEVQIRDSPVTVRSDSDNDFDEVMPVEPEIIERVMSIKPIPKQNIEVVISKNQNYKPEDDIFADIFPVDEAPKEIPLLTPEKIKTPLEKIVQSTPDKSKTQAEKIVQLTPEKNKTQPEKIVEGTPTKSGGLQERVENFMKEKIEIELKKAERTPEKMVNLNGTNERDIDEVSQLESENQKAESERISKDLEVPQMSSEELKSLESALEDKHEELLAEKGRQERLAASITDQMCAEAQELLRLFGVPFVVAPMEAEAQCAFLDALSLTEGTITDDSDIWLFGGNKVYKNFFNQKKHVLQYTSTTIQHYLKLERNHMILIALLVGSDYTTGLQGIGPVTAMEVLAAFPPGKVDNTAENRETLIEGLRRFRDWWQAGRPQRSAATTHLRNKVKDLKFYEGFPSLAVVDAYLRPAVDESREMFSWGDLDLQGLRDFARMKFGWAQAKADEILLPVAKRVAERKNQRFIDSYFNMVPQYSEGDKKMSKRVKKAVRRMENEESDSEDVDDPQPRPTQKKSAPKSGPGRKRKTQEDEAGSGEDDPQPRPTQRRSAPRSGPGRKKKTQEEAAAFGEEDDPQPRPTQKSAPTRKKSQEEASEEDESSSAPRKRVNQQEEAGEAPSEPKKSKPSRTIIKAKPQDGESPSKEHDDFPKPRPRQRTSTGVVRKGVEGPPKKIVSGNEEEATKKVGQPRKNAEPRTSGEPVKKTATKRTAQPRKKAALEEIPPLDTVNEEDETPAPAEEPQPGPSKRARTEEEHSVEPQPGPSRISSDDFDPKPGTSKDDPKPDTSKDDDIDEEEEAILAALHAMDWDDDPWGGFEPPRERIFFGGVRKNPVKPRARPPPPQAPLPPLAPLAPLAPPAPPPSQGIDSRGYRPGTRTLERIESRVTQPQLEWNSPSHKIPQKERDRQLAEESKMKAIKLFKAAGAVKKHKLLGADPESSKRKPKKKKPVAKLKELNLSEESSSDD